MNLRSQQDVMIIFCDEGDYYWAKKFATPELLNSTRDEQPFILHLIDSCYMSERILKAFVKKGANIPSTILHSVMVGTNYRLVPFLVKLGVDINARNGEGKTPLCRALSFECSLPLIETLLEAGAEVSTEMTKRTKGFAASFIRCRLAKDAFMVCAKKCGVSRDMTNLIGQMIWGTRTAKEWRAEEIKVQKH